MRRRIRPRSCCAIPMRRLSACGAQAERVSAREHRGRLGLTAARFKPKPLRHRGDRMPDKQQQQQQRHRGAPNTPLRAIHGPPRTAVAPHTLARVQSFNITWRYANRRAVTALAKPVAKSRRRQAPRQPVASHNTSSCWRPAGAPRRGHPGPKHCRSAARTSLCAFLRRPSPRCAWTDRHRFGEYIATRLHACCARLHSRVRATRPRKSVACAGSWAARLNAARSSRSRFGIAVAAASQATATAAPLRVHEGCSLLSSQGSAVLGGSRPSPSGGATRQP